MEKDQSQFLEPKTILAIVLVAVVFFGWQSYLNKKYPQYNKPAAVTKTEEGTKVAVTPGTVGPSGPVAASSGLSPNKNLAPAAIADEKLTAYDSDDFQFDISSQGMGIKNAVLKKYKNRENLPVTFAKDNNGELFQTVLVGLDSQPNFIITKKDANTFVGTANVGEMTIEKTITIDPQLYTLKTSVKIDKIDPKITGIEVLTADKKHPKVESSIFKPALEVQDFVVNHDGSTNRVSISSAKDDINQDFKNVTLTALGSQYFTAALLDKSIIIPEVTLKAGSNDDLATIATTYRLSSKVEAIELNYSAYVGPKSKSIFEQVDKEMTSIIDFGMFGVIGKVLLEVLKWINNFAGNWGVSIVLLTLLVRGLVAPLNISSYRSMKKMQKISPLMATLRTKYKDDPTTLNKEMMALMKENKVNPLGGCLPMVVQMPVFFALYQVLKSSIELYQTPFFGWIHDLSLKDPYYILPAIMGGAMFLQQKITPNTMDPAQAKIMQFLPIVFSFMMISLPSGLTLYIAISTIFGIIQQQVFTRDAKKQVSA